VANSCTFTNGNTRDALCQEWFPNCWILREERVQEDLAVFQRHWNICIEPNGLREAMINEYSQSEQKDVAPHVIGTWDVYEENFSHGESLPKTIA
jgi:hypothetical protein